MTDPLGQPTNAEARARRESDALAETLDEFRRRIRKLERTNTISRGSVLDYPIDVYDTDENLSMQVGQQYDGAVIANPVVGPLPPIPTPPTLTPGLRSVTVHWDGEWEPWYDEDGLIIDDQVVAPTDFARVEIHASTDPDFTAEFVDTLVGTFETPRGGDQIIPIPADGFDYTVKLVARTISGKRSTPSDGVEVQAQDVDASDGLPPAASPTPVAIGQPGSVYLAWDEVINNDPVTYSIYADDSTPVTIDDTHRIADTSATAWLATMYRTDAGVLTRLPYGADTYFAIVASDEDGPSSSGPGASVAARPLRQQTDDLDDDLITLAKLAPDTSNAIANAASSAADALDAADDALTIAQAAQATADGSIRTYYQSAPPWANGTTQPDSVLGDMWFDQDDGQAYRWNGTSWQVIEDSSIAAALAAAQNAQTTADGKIDAYYQTTAPTTGSVGDLWYDTDAGNKAYYCSSTSPLTWTAIPPGLAALGPDVTARALGATFTYYQTAAPSLATTVDGDLWIDTDDNNKLYRRTGGAWVASDDQRLQQALTAAANAQSTADGKIRLFAQATAPGGLVAADAGDLWIETDDGNRLWRWSGSAWVDARDTTIAAAAAAAATAQSDASTAIANAAAADAKADGKVATYFQTSAPWANGLTTHDTDVGDLWFDTDDANKMYRWGGAANRNWVLSDDTRISQAVTAAANAQTTANGKITTFYQTAPPTSTAIGDLWVDTDDGNRIYRAAVVGATTIGAGAWVDVRDATIATAAAAASAAQTAANNAMTAAQTAQATADGAIRTYYQSAAPWANGTAGHANDAGDMWFDTDDGQAYRWDDSTKTWVTIEDNSIAAALAAAQNAQTTADGKISTFFATTQPWANGAAGHTNDVGDLWYQTNAGNKPWYWNGTAWVALPVGLSGLGTDVTARALGSITTTISTTAPVSPITGDMWMDSANGNRLKRWSGSAWVDVQDTAIQTAITNAANAANLADAKMRIFYENKDPAALRPASNPTMTATDVGDLWFRTDETNRPYRWTGSVWSPFNLGGSAVNTTDGLAPTSSPTPTIIPTVGALLLRWTAVTNQSPVTYRVYGSKTSGFTPSPTTLLGEVVGTSFTVKRLAGVATETYNPELSYNSDAYFKIIAADGDEAVAGTAPASAEAAGRPIQIDDADVAAEAIYGRHIAGGEVTADKFSAELALASKMSTGSIDQTEGSPTFGEVVGQRIDLDPSGLGLFDPAGEKVVWIPTNSEDVAYFKGKLETGELTIKGGTTIESTGNQIAKDGSLTLAAGVADPANTPDMKVEYDTIRLQKVSTGPLDASFGNLGTFSLDYTQIECIGWHPDGYYLVAQKRSGGFRLWRYNTDGTVLYNLAQPTKVWCDDMEGWSEIRGLWGYGTSFSIGWGGKFNGQWAIIGHKSSSPITGASVATQFNFLPTSGNGSVEQSGRRPYFFLDRSLAQCCMVESFSSAQYIKRYNITNTYGGTIGYDTRYAMGTSFGTEVGGFEEGNFFGAGGVRFAMGFYNSTTMMRELSKGAGGTTIADTLFAPNGPQRGFTYNGANYVTVDSTGYLTIHTNWTWTGTNNSLWAAVSFHDLDAAGGTHQTKVGKKNVLVIPKRAKVRITMPLVPDKGGTDDPDRARLWMLRSSSSTPADSALKFVSEGLSGYPTLVQNTAVIVADPATASPTPPTANNFPGANPGFIEAAGTRVGTGRKGLKLDGAGFGWADAVAPPGAMFAYAAGRMTSEPLLAIDEWVPGWLICDGRAVSRSLYAALFAVIGTTFGVGDGSTTFNLPDTQRRHVLGVTSNLLLGQNEGNATPSTRNIGHSHTVDAHDHGGANLTLTKNPRGTATTATPQAVTDVGGVTGTRAPGTDGWTPPYLGLHWIIKW